MSKKFKRPFQKKDGVEKSLIRGVRMLKIDGSYETNYAEWKNEIQLYLYQEYGHIGEVVEFEQHHAFATPTIGVSVSPAELRRSSRRASSSATASSTSTSSASDSSTSTPTPMEVEEHKIKLKAHIDAVNRYEDNLIKAFADILSTLSLDSRDKVMLSEKYADVNLSKDPLELFQLIKTSHVGARGSIEIVARVERTQIYENIKQLPNESIRDYRDRIRVAIDGMKAVGLTPPTEDIQTVRFIKGLDEARFLQMQAHISNATTLGTMTYPKNVDDAARFASEYVVPKKQGVGLTPAAAFVTVKKSPKQKKATYEATVDAQETKDNKKTTEVKESAKKETKSKIKCFFCEKTGHRMEDCYSLQAAKRDGVLDKYVKKRTTDESEASGYVAHAAHAFPLIFHARGKVTEPTVVLLDNQATDHIFFNKELLSNLRQGDSTIRFGGLGGDVTTNMMGDFGPIGKVWFSKETPVNILSWSKLVREKFEVSYKSETDVFVINFGEESTWEFKLLESGLYGHNFRAQTFITVAEAESRYTHRQVQDAKKARELIRTLGVPSVAAVKSIVHNGQATGFDISPKDIDRAIDIYGPPLASLKGKSTEPKPIKAKYDRIDHKVAQELNMYTDIMFVCGLPFMVSVLKPIGLVISTFMGKGVKAKGKDNVLQIIKSHVAIARSENFIVRVIHADGEGAVKSIVAEIRSMGIVPNLLPGQHVGDVEVVIKLLKNWARGILHTLPFKLHLDLVPELIAYVAQRINLFPSKRGYVGIPAIQALSGIKVDISKEARLPFGEYVQCTTPNIAHRNDVRVPRTEGGIVMGQANRSGGLRVLSLHTKKIMVRNKMETINMPEDVIANLNSWAEAGASIEGEEDLEEDIQTQEVHSPEYQSLQESTQHDVVESTSEQPPTEAEEKSEEEESNKSDSAPEVDDPIISTSEDIADVVVEEEEEEVSNSSKEQVATAESISESGSNGRSKRSTGVNYRQLHRFGFFVATKVEAWGFNLSVKKATEMLGSAATEAIKKELTMLLEKQVFHPVKWEDVSKEDKIKSIRSFMFMKEKYLPSGKFDKVKARLVGNGAQQDRDIFESLSSPTTSLTSLMIVGTLAARDGKTVVTADITGAYLNAMMPDRQVMLIGKEISEILISMDENYKKFLRRNGDIPVVLDRALYGCVQSALLWYNTMRQFMVELGFAVNPYDECVFSMGMVTVVLYVDDLLIVSSDDLQLNSFLVKLKNKFKEITVNHGTIHNYLGMVLDFSRKGVFRVSMDIFINKIVQDFNGKGHAPTPALDDMFKSDSGELLNDNDRQTFHSAVASILYAAKRARPDVLLATSYLTTRVSAPTEGDMKKLQRLLSYLRATTSKGIELSASEDMRIKSYIDASYAAHSDGKSHSGMLITLGSGPIFVKSNKQKIVTKSTWEAELVALSDGCSQAIWTQHFMSKLGYEIPVVIYQDNKATIASIKKGRPSSDRSRHVNVKYFWLSSKLQEGSIDVQYMPTEDMIADVLTKPMQGSLFKKLERELRGETDTACSK